MPTGGGYENTKQSIKDFTKKFYGLRPMSLMIYYAFIFSRLLGLSAVYGVDDKYAISSFKRGKKRKGRVLNIHNLDDIYIQNCKIIKNFYGYKQLNFIFNSIEQIPSNKRSMYKKRYDFLASLWY